MEAFVNYCLLGLLLATGIAVIKLRSLFAGAMLFGIYSLLSAAVFVALDAVDVAFTEAAVGAGISTVLMLATLSIVGIKHEAVVPESFPALIAVILVGGLLIYGMTDLPHFGSADAPVHQHVAPRYIEQSGAEVGVPNIVTSVLASYRGYDTLGEVTVIFTAGIGVLCLLGFRRRKQNNKA